MQDEKFTDAIQMLSAPLCEALSHVAPENQRLVTEIRLRVGKPLVLMLKAQVFFPGQNGELMKKPGVKSIVTDKQELQNSFLSICGWAVHSHQKELSDGFIAVKGGHRAGIAGTAAVEDGKVRAVRDISSINLRIAREIRGTACGLLHMCFADRPVGVLLVGEPASGKTTVLRDLCYQLADGKNGSFHKVCVVDESGELGGVCSGVPGHDLGVCSDLLSGYPKAKGLEIAVRYLSPQIVVCDEICTPQEIDAVVAAANSGVAVVTSIHAGSFEELRRKRQFLPLMKSGAFSWVVLLEGAGTPSKIKEIRRMEEFV